jgi:hypothetical protein
VLNEAIDLARTFGTEARLVNGVLDRVAAHVASRDQEVRRTARPEVKRPGCSRSSSRASSPTASTPGAHWVFADEQPLRSAAGLVDWQMSGYLSRLLWPAACRDKRTRPHVATQRRASRHDPPVGLGIRSLYGFERIADVTPAVTRMLRSCAWTVAIEVPGSRPSGSIRPERLQRRGS